MTSKDGSPKTLYFDDYCLELRSLELRKRGLRVRLRHQPTQVLAFLASRAGELVTREELQREVWGSKTFVDFERGLNNCIKQIRESLNDHPESPRYVETIPRKGYRFVANVATANGHDGNGAVARSVALPQAAPQPAASLAEPIRSAKALKLPLVWIAALAGALAIAAIARWTLFGLPAFSFQERDSILISDFENHTGDPRFDNALLTAFTVSLEQSRHANIVPRTRIVSTLKRMGKSGTERVTAEIGREICQRENVRGLVAAEITRTGQQYGLSAQLIDPSTGIPVRSYDERVAGEDYVLAALDRIAAKIRADLGESLYQIHRARRPLPEVTTASLTALKRYADAKELWRSGKYDEALALFAEAIALDPDFAMAHAALGNAYCSHIFNYQRERGTAEYEKALSLSSRVTDRERRIIELGYNNSLGHVEVAEKLFVVYLNDYPDDWTIRYAYANLLRMRGRELDAIGQYKELLRIAPNDPDVYIQIATAYKTMGNSPDAVRSYAEAFRLDPAKLSISNINREYGFTLIANGEEAKAEKVFSDLASDPVRRASGLDSLALLDLMHGRYAKARERLEEALSIVEQRRDLFLIARNHFLLAIEAAGEGKRGRETSELDAALMDFNSLGPKVEYGSLVGQEYAREGAIDKAEKIAKLITPLADPNSDEQSGYLRLLQGEILIAKGSPLEASRLLDLQDQRYGGSIISISIEALARADQKAGKMDDAISSYKKLLTDGGCRLLSWEPQQRCVEARLALAKDLLDRGNKQEAKSTLAPLLRDWRDADPSLALKKQASELAAQTAK